MRFDGQDAPNSSADRAFPRFLSRGASDAVTAAPPPLPEEPWPVRLQQVFAALPPAVTYATMAVMLAVPATVSVFGGGRTHKTEAGYAGHVVAARNEVADALRIVAEFEARLDYTGNLANIAQVSDVAHQVQTGAAQSVSATLDESASVPMQTEAVDFHLPDSVTATASGPVNEAAWTWAASDPVAIVMMPEDETIAPPGLTVGALHQDGGTEPQTIDEKLAAPMIVVSQVTGESSQLAEAGPKPAPRPHHARVRAEERVAVEDGSRKKRVKRSKESVIAKTIVKTVPVQGSDGTDDVATDTTEEKKPGVFTKLFSWLKGGNNQQQASDGASDGQKAGLLRQH
jgi:hypothetical protein